MASFEFLAIILTGLGLTASIVYYARVIGNQNKTQELQLETRQTQLFMQIYNRWTDPLFNENYFDLMDREWEDFDDWMKRYGDQVKIRASNRAIDQYFESIGVLVYRGLIDIALLMI